MSKRIPILVIEDEEHIRIILEYNLRLDGFEVYLAEDGPMGIELAREKRPDLILLDWMMPKMNGPEVLIELKNDKRTEHIPVFMLTVKGMIRDIDQALKAGADDYMTKPFDPMELGKTIKRKLQEYGKVESR
jgi:two-component system alkaline phosphatase synthesis response regulator PhoP